MKKIKKDIINWNEVFSSEQNIDLIRISHYIERFFGSESYNA